MIWTNARMKIKKIIRIATKIGKAEPVFFGLGGRAVRGRVDSEQLDTAAAKKICKFLEEK